MFWLGALEVEVGLTRLLLPAAELLRQERRISSGDIGIVVVGKAVIGALRIQKSGVGRGVLRQRRADAAVFGDDVPGGGEGIRPLAAKAGGGERRLAHGVFIGYRGIIPQFVGRVKIF